MNPKRMIMVGSMAVTISISSALWSDKTGASPMQKTGILHPADAAAGDLDTARKDMLLNALGLASDDELYEALYNGRSLAAIAADHGGSVQDVIKLQTDDMKSNLDKRLASGSVTYEQYQAQLAELPEIITKSTYGTSSMQ